MEGTQETIKAAFEAILFSSAEAVSSKRVAQILNITPVELEQIAMEVIKKFECDKLQNSFDRLSIHDIIIIGEEHDRKANE